MKLPDIVALLHVCRKLMPLLELAEEEGANPMKPEQWTPEQTARVNRRISNDPRLIALISDREVIAFMERFDKGAFE